MSFSMYDSDDIFDSCDVQARIDRLEAELEEVNEAREALSRIDESDFDSEDEYLDAVKAANAAILLFGGKTAEAEEHAAMCTLRDEVSSREWTYGITFVKESYFTAYCEELVKDIGDLPKDIPSYLVIDWDKTADNLMIDYTSVEFNGSTYYYRD